MDIEERLRLESARFAAPLDPLERQRYELVAELCRDAAVLELGCGGGEGSRILATPARSVLTIDPEVAALDGALTPDGGESPLRFAAGLLSEAVAGAPAERADVIVCLTALADPAEHARCWPGLLARAGEGRRLALAWPAVARGGGPSGAGLTYEAIQALAAELTVDTVILPQFRAEGSLLLVPGAEQTEFAPLDPPEAAEPAYADAFLLLVGFGAGEVAGAHRGRLRVDAQAAPNRLESLLVEEIRTLRSENARLGRAYLGKGGSAAASALNRLGRIDEELAGTKHLLRLSEAKVVELEGDLAALARRSSDETSDEPAREAERIEPAPPVLEAVVARPLQPAAGEDPNSWEMRYRRADEVMIPWIERTVSLSGKTVLEYGSGYGSVSCAVAERAGRVIGVDIDREAVEFARAEVDRRGLDNVELHHRPVEEILGSLTVHAGTIDVFLLYAVLEHLTVDECLAVLDLARRSLREGGVIVVCESPNRLIYFDHHTGQMPFFHLLPEALALRYRGHLPREVIRSELDAAVAEGPAAASEGLTRLGRGVSFHEFELAFGDRLDQHVIATNYDPGLFGERPVHPDEVILARYLNRWRPDLPPVFSRYWLDFILSPTPVDRRPPMIRPWAADTVASGEVGYTSWENLRLKGALSTLWIELPEPTERLVVGAVTQHGRWMVLEARADGREPPITAGHTAGAHEAAFSDLRLPWPSARIALRASDECDLVFVGYEA